MAPNPDLIINIDPAEAGSETIRTLVLPWSGQSVPVRIPPGMTDGAMLRLPGIGPATAPGGPARDAYVQVRIVPGAAGSASPTAPLGAVSPASAPPGAVQPTSAPPTSAPPTAPLGAVPPASAPPTVPFGAVPPNSVPPGAPYGAAGGAYPPVTPQAKGSGKGKILAVVGGAVAVVLLAILAVPVLLWASRDSVGGTPSNRAGGSTADASPSPTASPSPSATPISPPEYQALLAEVDKSVGDAFKKLGKAKNPKAVGAAVDDIESAVERQITTLSAVTPPANVASAHADLLRGLEDLADSLAETGSAAGAGEVCVGSSALARLSRESSAEEVRAARQALATADPAQPYQVGDFIPKKTSDTNRRLSNGKFLKRTKSGLGQLKIENGGRNDAVINVVRSGSKSPMVSVYVRAKSKFTVTGVRDGVYQIYMTGGKDWDDSAKAFSRDCSFQRFEDSFRFTTTSTQYTIWTITLTPVVGGNARTSDVDPGSFPS